MSFDIRTDTKAIRHSNAVAAGSSVITPSAGVDMSGFDTVTFEVLFGTITSGAATSIEVHTSSDDGSADAYTALAGTKVTVADDDDNKLVQVTVHRPPEKWVKCIVNRATQNAVLDGIVARLYNGSEKLPITQPATVVAGETHVSPAEGTA